MIEEHVGRLISGQELNIRLGTEILGLIILPNILNSVTYVELLRNNLPDFLKDIPLLERNKIIFPDLWISFSGATARNYFIYKTLPEDTKDLETRLRYAMGYQRGCYGKCTKKFVETHASLHYDDGHFEHLL